MSGLHDSDDVFKVTRSLKGPRSASDGYDSLANAIARKPLNGVDPKPTQIRVTAGTQTDWVFKVTGSKSRSQKRLSAGAVCWRRNTAWRAVHRWVCSVLIAGSAPQNVRVTVTHVRSGVTREGPPRVTPSRGSDTRMKLIFCGQVYGGHWTNDVERRKRCEWWGGDDRYDD